MEEYYSTLSKGTPRPAQDVAFALSEVNKEDTNTADVLGAAARSAFVGSAVARSFERRSSQFTDDDTWKIDQDVETQLIADYAPKDIDYLKEAGSKDEFVARKKFIQEDDDRERRMMSGGWTGVGARVAFEMLDPAAWVASAATGGVSWIKKGSGVYRAAKLGTAIGLENVAIDSMLMAGDTNSEASDLIMSFGAGALIGGALGALSKNVDNVRIADEIDNGASIDAQNHIIKKGILDQLDPNGRPIRKAFPDSDARAVQADMDSFEGTLKGTMAERVSREEGITVKKQIADLEAEGATEATKLDTAIKSLSTESKKVIDSVDSADIIAGKRKAIETQMTARMDAIKSKIKALEESTGKSATQREIKALMEADDELIAAGKAIDDALAKEVGGLKARKKGLERKLASKISKLEKDYAAKAKKLADKMKPLQGRLGTVPKALAAQKNLQAWNKLSMEDKVKFLYGEGGPPSRTVHLADEIAGREGMVFVEEKALPVEGGLKEKAGSVGSAEAGFTEIYHNEPYSLNEKATERIDGLSRLGADAAEDVRGEVLPWKSRITDAMHSAQALISNSRSYAIRGFGYLLFEAPQGGKAGAATAAIRKQVYDNRIRGAMRNRLNEGVYEFGREKKLSWYKSLMDQKHIDSYNKAVMIEVMRPDTYSSPAIKKGAAGVRAQLLEAGQIRKAAGEAGFENINLDKNYVPIVMDPLAIKRSLRSGAHPASRVRAVLSEAYQKGGFKLDSATADRLADVMIKRAMDDTLVMKDQVRGVTNKDLDALKAGLEKAGIDADVIKEIIEDSMDAEIKKHMSNRAKKSLLPRIDVEVEGLKFIDLIDNDLPKILESYTRDAAGGAAFAKMGYKTRSQVLDQISHLEMDATQRLKMPKAQIDREIQILKDGVDMVYGRTLNTSDPRLVKAFSRARDITGLLRLQFVGAASIPELARVTSQYSIASVLESVKDIGAFRGTKHLREGGKYSGAFKRQDLEEMDEIMHFAGEDQQLYSHGLRADDIEESEYVGRIGSLLDRAAAQGRRVQEIASGFKLIQGTGERLAVRSLALDIKKMIAGTGKPLREASINRAGWGDGFLDELAAFMKANPKTMDHGGKEVTLFNFGKMSPDMQERLQIGIHRLVRSDMQRPNIGETPMFMNKWMGQTFTQFRSFSILSMEKQLVHDYRQDKAMGALIAMQSAMYGIMAAGIASMQRNIGKENAEEKIKSDMSGSNLTMGVMNRMGQLAALGIGLDVLATLGLLPDGMLSKRDQIGARAMTSDSVPVFGLAKDLVEVPTSIFGAMKGEVEGSKVIKDIQDVTPFAKSIGLNQGINALRGSLE